MTRVETWDAIRSRRNTRTYEDRPIPEAHLDRILEAARRTPSSTNWQPWEFVVVTDRDRLRRLSEIWQWGRHVAGSSATVSLLAPIPQSDDDRDWTWYDHGQATMSIMLAAADLGIGSCHAAVGDQELAREILGHPEDRFCTALVSLGYPADRPLRPIGEPNRRPFDEVVRRERW
jgi:nitroreductase